MSVCNLLVAASPAFIQQESAAVFPPVLKAAFRQRADCRWFFNTKASVDKSTRACGPDWTAVRCVIVLDMRQHACVLCLADNAPDRPASPSEFFTEDKRRLARQTRQAGCRPPTRITTPAVVLPREKPCVLLSADAKISQKRILTQSSGKYKIFLEQNRKKSQFLREAFCESAQSAAAGHTMGRRREIPCSHLRKNRRSGSGAA